jgi:hypothetical protein
VGLIAREIEAKGISTLSLSSAFSITRSVNPPRALFLDFPLGHTAGKAGDADLQDAIIESALIAFETMRTPGSIMRLPFRWADHDDWKDSVMRPRAEGAGDQHRDDRGERSGEPQYQCEADRVAAERADS